MWGSSELGPPLGRAAGGVVAGSLGWQWIFFGGALLGLVAIVFAVVFVDAGRTESEGSPARWDSTGWAPSCPGLYCWPSSRR